LPAYTERFYGGVRSVEKCSEKPIQSNPVYDRFKPNSTGLVLPRYAKGNPFAAAMLAQVLLCAIRIVDSAEFRYSAVAVLCVLIIGSPFLELYPDVAGFG